MPDADSTLALAEHYLAVGRPADALRVLDDAGGDAPSNPEYWLVRARASFGLRRWQEAAGAARRGLAVDPEDVALLNMLALSQLNGGLADIAEVTLGRALELEPESPVLHADLGLTLACLKRFPEARAEVERALRLAPWSAHAQQVRAKVAVLADDPDADRVVDALLADDPEDDVAHALKGTIASRKKDFAAAARAFDEAARLDPQDPANVGTARQARLVMHPLLAPLRPIWRYGWWTARVAVVAVWLALLAAGLHGVAEVVILLWLALIAYSYVAPRIVRRRARKRYGGF